MKTWISLVMLAIILLAGCGRTAAPGPAGDSKPGGQKGGTAESSWQKDWDSLKQAAQKEGEIVLITSSGVGAQALTSLNKTWEAAGFKVTLFSTALAPTELSQKVSTELKAGMNNYDVGLIGQNTLTNVIKPLGSLAPIDDKVIVLPEVKEPKNWYGNRLHYADKEKMILNTVFQIGTDVWVNTNMINPDSIKSYSDLLKPEYKGKIMMGDVRVAGSPQQWLGAVIAMGAVDENYLRKLKEQVGVMSADRDQTAQWVAQGKYPIGVAVTPSTIQALKKQGAPVAVIRFKESYTGGGSGSLVMFNKAPHPNAARLFINWFMTKDTQTAITPSMGYQSARVDVPTTGLVNEAIRQEGINYYDVGTEEFQASLKKVREMAERVFGAPGKEAK